MNKLLCALVLCGFASACNKDAAAPTPTAMPVANAPTVKVAGSPTKLAVGEKTHCPVTGEEFTVSDKTAQVQHDGKYYAFCCPDCAPTFEKNPAKYASKN